MKAAPKKLPQLIYIHRLEFHQRLEPTGVGIAAAGQPAVGQYQGAEQTR
jgi:hypothetical protein